VFLHSLATAVPPRSFTQPEIWQALERSPWVGRLRPGSLELLQRILTGDSGIERRHFAFEAPEEVFMLEAQALNERFEATAPGLAADALARALDRAGWGPGELDGLIVCTCTGYLCPGLTSFVAERLALPSAAWLSDLAGQGCGAAIPMLRQAAHFLAAHPRARIATVAVEVCSAAFHLDDNPGVLISACLFADGAAAALWSGTAPEHGPAWRCGAFQTLHLPEHRERLRFANAGGKLRNILHRAVPAIAAEAVARLHQEANLGPSTTVLAHTGGKKVVEALRGVLPGHALAETESILRSHGNMSSPAILFVLDEALRRGGSGPFWLTSFGAGFTCHGCTITGPGAAD
jgi:alkylresorcinol/alkylpyrone synthase